MYPVGQRKQQWLKQMTGIGETESYLGNSKPPRGFYYTTSYFQVLYSTRSQKRIS